MKLPRGSRSPLIAESGDQKDTFNRGRQVSDNGMRRDLGLLTIQKLMTWRWSLLRWRIKFNGISFSEIEGLI
ncbi:unnamed protein product [Brassica oleracea var. botrytis]